MAVSASDTAGSRWRFPSLDPHKHRIYINAASALLVAVFTYYVTDALPYFPASWRVLIILAIAVLWLFAPRAGVPVALLVYVLAASYNSPYGFGAILVLGSLGVISLIVLDPYTFILFCFATYATTTGSGWLVPLAVLLLAVFGPRAGAARAAFLCLAVELLMFLNGLPAVGPLTGGVGNVPLWPPHAAPVPSLLDFAWIAPSVGAGSAAQSLLNILTQSVVNRPILIAQIGLWAVVGGVQGALLYRPLSRDWLDRLPRFARALPGPARAIGAGALVLIVGQFILTAILDTARLDPFTVAASAIGCALIAIVIFPVLEVAYQSMAWPSGALPARPSITAANADKPAGERSAKREIPADTWDELVGVDDIKDEVLEAVRSQFDPESRAALKRMALKPTRGILLFGPPGTGKTKLARIIAHEAGAAFFAVSGTEFASKWFGESEANLRRIFLEARQNKPSVLFFDELEAFLPKRGDLSRADAPEKGIVGTFLSFTDGVGDMDGVLLVGATNYPNLIDPAAVRPGRFDKLIYVSAPDLAGRRAIFASYLKNKPTAPDIDLDKLAARTERFTGADIQLVCTEAARKALRRAGNRPEPITMDDLETAVGGIRPSVTFQMLRDYEEMSDTFGRRSARAATVDVIAKPDLSWDDVAGLETVKDALRDAIEFPLRRPELLEEYGIKPSRGVLLFGPPGCGKTYLAKVVASASGAHFLQVKGPELLQSHVGQSEARLRDLFGRARENAPCVLFFDEIDAIAGARGTSDENATQILTQFLTEMDGVDELKGVVVMAATNRPDTIDPALMRPGRLDRVLYVPPPDLAGRLQLFQHELSNKPTAPNIDLDLLAHRSDGYSSADLTAICNAAAAAAARDSLNAEKRTLITTERLMAQLERTPPSITTQQIATYEELRDRLQR